VAEACARCISLASSHLSFRFETKAPAFIPFITITMSEVKHYGTTDLYDPDRPVEEVSTSAKVDPVTLGRNVRAWMRNRVRNRISNDAILEVSLNVIQSLRSNTN